MPATLDLSDRIERLQAMIDDREDDDDDELIAEYLDRLIEIAEKEDRDEYYRLVLLEWSREQGNDDEGPDDFRDLNQGPYGEGRLIENHRREYAVMDEEEADRAWDASLDSHLDDAGVMDAIPENLRQYFDRNAWKEDAKNDGRGHSLSGYDGEEHEQRDLYIYRTN